MTRTLQILPVLFFPTVVLGQSASLTISSASGTPGGKAKVYLSLQSSGSQQPAGLQWNLSYSPVDFSALQVTEGPSAIASGKLVFCAGVAGSPTCLVTGLNSNTIPDGVIAMLTFVISATATRTTSPIQLLNPVDTSLGGNALPITASGGSVTILPLPPAVLSIITTGLPIGTVGSPYAQKLTAAGGTPPYGWSLIAGAPPPGLVLAPSGTLSGTPTLAGTSSFTVQLTDSAGAHTSLAFALTIHLPLPSVTISGVFNGAGFQPSIAPGSWLMIAGSNLSSNTRRWGADIVNGRLPTQLDGVGVTVNGKPAFVSYISPTYINALAPNDNTVGPVPVQVTNNGVFSNPATVQLQEFSPAFFLWPGKYVVATRTDFSLVAKVGEFPSTATIPAKPGEIIILWGTGFGPTSPSAPAGQLVPGNGLYAMTATPTVTVGNLAAEYLGGALSPNSAGLYQVAIRVPAAAPNGDLPVAADIGGVLSPAGVLLTVQQ